MALWLFLAAARVASYHADMPVRRAILLAYFVLGAYAVMAQATLLREAQVILFGSELSWGLVLAFWLLGFGLGAGLGALGPRHSQALMRSLVFGICAVPGLLALAIMFLRVARIFAGAGTGEYVAPGHMVWISLVATAPVSLIIGWTLPAASVLVAGDATAGPAKARAIGWVYLVESAGSLVGGALFSFVLVGRVPAITLALAGGAVLTASTIPVVLSLARHRAWALAPAGVAAMLALVVLSGLAAKDDAASLHLRWSSFARGERLVDSWDSRYENIALGQLEDQFSLYLNGLVAATWPNHTVAAAEAHLAACECPAPRRILLLGGGLEGMLKELLRYRPERLDYVTLDPQAVERVVPCLDGPDREAAEAVRQGGGFHYMDIRRFVKQAARAGRRYDLVLLAAPEPSSTLEARLYTLEFFEEVAGLLSDDGVLTFALRGSVGFWSPEPAEYVGSVVGPLRGPLRSVFPDVLLTFGYPTRVFAARRPGALTDLGETLASRYKARGIQSPYFDPLYFEGATDMFDPDKRAALLRSLAAYRPAFLNTDSRPVAAVYYMRFRLQATETSHAGPEAPATGRPGLLAAVLGLRFNHVTGALAVATVLAALVGLARGRRGYRRAALAWSVGTTGFASMAIEMVLLYTFQTSYGYVYSMIGFIVGVFMFGLVVGSLLANWRLGRAAAASRRPPGLRSMVLLDIGIAVFAAALVLGLGLLRNWASDWAVQGVTFALVAVSGMLGGLVFPLAAAVYLEEETSAGRAAGAVAAADYVGACLGALLTGIALVPVLGVSGACMVVAAMKGLSALVVGTAAALRTPASSPAAPPASLSA